MKVLGDLILFVVPKTACLILRVREGVENVHVKLNYSLDLEVIFWENNQNY